MTVSPLAIFITAIVCFVVLPTATILLLANLQRRKAPQIAADMQAVALAAVEATRAAIEQAQAAQSAQRAPVVDASGAVIGTVDHVHILGTPVVLGGVNMTPGVDPATPITEDEVAAFRKFLGTDDSGDNL